ncbi:MAG: hypothetical protein M3Z10_13550 [Gemmatimonadota bacterium]|nr:hypothetical protein [Gemmatimonadota bacterium]
MTIRALHPTLLSVTFALAGCAPSNRVDVAPQAPSAAALAAPPGERVFRAPINAVWDALMRQAARPPFSLEQAQPDARLARLAWSADDPTQYVECGRFASLVKSAQGERVFAFPSAAASEEYLVADGNTFVRVLRSIQLSGSTVVQLQALGDSATRTRVETRYTILKHVTAQAATPLGTRIMPGTGSWTTTFATPEEGAEASPEHMRCRATGAIERAVLDRIARELTG